MKPTNPKDAIGSDKLPLHLWPTTATAQGALALLDGALKYGRSNFRVVGVRASIYYDAARRHLDGWFEGEDTDPDSGLSHLAHALACLAIVVDAEAAGKLTDDRMAPGGWRGLVSRLTPEVARLRAVHAECAPVHYMRESVAELHAGRVVHDSLMRDIARRVDAEAKGGAGGPHGGLIGAAFHDAEAARADAELARADRARVVDALEQLLEHYRAALGAATWRSVCDCDPSVGIYSCPVCDARQVVAAFRLEAAAAARGACGVCGFEDCEKVRGHE